MQTSTYVIAIDFEAAGGVPAVNGFTQLGAAMVDMATGERVAHFNAYASMEGYEWDERCVKEFWLKHPDRFAETLEKCKNAPSPYVVVEQFLEWVKEVSAGKDAYLITDCSTFDTGLLKHFSKVDILYVLGPCRDIVDVSAVYMGLSRKFMDCAGVDGSSKRYALGALCDVKGCEVKWPEFPVTHDHDAVNDATVIAMRWCFVQRCLREECV
jgi:hypothetical protein